MHPLDVNQYEACTRDLLNKLDDAPPEAKDQAMRDDYQELKAGVYQLLEILKQLRDEMETHTAERQELLAQLKFQKGLVEAGFRQYRKLELIPSEFFVSGNPSAN